MCCPKKCDSVVKTIKRKILKVEGNPILAGIDIGLLSTNAVIMKDKGGNTLGHNVYGCR